jgi:hypothetical protein
MKKAAIAGFIFGVLVLIGAFVYFVSGVSATIAPIKKYQYSGSIDQLINGLRRYASANPDMTFKVTDITGDRFNGYATYMDIKMIKDRHHFEYSLKCEKKNQDNAPATTKAELVFAYDSTSNSGGYGAGALGIKVLIDNFDKDFLVGLKNNQNITLSPIKPTFLDR